MLKKFLLCASMSLAVLAVSVIGLGTLKDNGNMKIDTQNVAGSYTDYVDGEPHVDWSTGMMGVDKKYKDVYFTFSTSKVVYENEKYTFVDGWKGPTPMPMTVSYTEGTTRTTKFGGELEAKIFKLSGTHETTESSAWTVTKTFTFPGDNTTWNLYVKRKDVNNKGYMNRTSYVSELCYTYIWGIAAWDYYWSSYTYDAGRSFDTRLACDTTENQYSRVMIQE